MKIKNYKGFEIEICREKSITGIELLFYSIFRNKDGFEVDNGFSYSDETVREYIKQLKKDVDQFIKEGQPEEWE